MPRFLDTHTGEFVWVEDPSTIIYAILSHTWRSKEEGSEQTYTQVEKLRKRIQKARTSVQLDADSILSHPDLSDKIKGVCEFARKAGFKYVWIDSCCIDKTSSAELAEAINSMFDLYRLATVCYVYLSDVPGGTPTLDESSFAKSRWHTRGWTLQELIAPDRVVFLSSQWTSLGTKIGLAAMLQNITGIDVGLLTGRASLDSFSVARRMSWAARRETTRVEDEAYSLLGIFGVHMSPIYGEGRNAFIRLQEEIIKNIPDQSIFAWGSSIALASLNGPPASHRYNRASMEPTGLLAPSPSAFSDTRDVEPLPEQDFVSRFTDEATPAGDGQPGVVAPSLHCMFTPQGVRLDILCIDLAEMPQISLFAIRYIKDPPGSLSSYEDHVGRRTGPWYELEVDRVSHCLQRGRARSLAVLRCQDEEGRLLALPLFCPTPSCGDQRGISIATHTRCSSSCAGNIPFRLIHLSNSVLAAIRVHHLLSRHPSAVSFLRNSALGRSFTRPAFELVNGVDLWSILRNASLLAPRFKVQLEPACEEDLRLLGFQASPPTVVRSLLPEKCTVETALTSPLLEGESREWFRQHIRINLVVHSSWVGVNNLELQFCVNNSFHIPPPRHAKLAGDGRKEPPADQFPKQLAAPGETCTSCQLPRCTIVDAPSADSSDGSCTTCVSNHVTTRTRKTDRTIARAQFVVYADWDSRHPRWEPKPGGAVVRDLRLTLECPWEAFDEEARAFCALWLSVELSEAYVVSDGSTLPPAPVPT